MTPKLLLDNFDKLASAPNGIAKLREMILQLAVQGKLVSQNPKDEPASKLLKKIRTEKEKLIKEGKIRKRKLSKIDTSVFPYAVPSSWKWVRLGGICREWGQKKPDSKFTYIDVASIDKERGVISDNLQVLLPEEAPSRARKLVRKGTVIYSTVRPYLLNIAIIDRDFKPEPIVSTAFGILHLLGGVINRYLYYYLRSRPFIDYVESEMIGMAYPAINDGKLFNGLVPLPPLAEQNRIVARVDELMALCDKLEAQHQKQASKLLAFNASAIDHMLETKRAAQLNKHWKLICENFDLLYEDPENVKKLRLAILQLAVQGKLVPQYPNVEPASVLLEKIKAEKEKLIKQGKIKKQKPHLPIEPDQIPYEIPTGWEWTRLGILSNDIHYGYTASADENIRDVRLLRITDIQNNKVDWRSVPGCMINKKDVQKYDISDGDILIARTGGTIGKSYLVDNLSVCAVFASYLIRVVPNRNTLPEYCKRFLESPLYWRQLYSMSMGTGQPNVNATSLKGLNFPLPPVAEQKRIVAKVDELMALCDELEDKLKQSQSKQEKLMTSIVHHLLVV